MSYNFTVISLRSDEARRTPNMLVYFAHPSFTSEQQRIKGRLLEKLNRSLALMEQGEQVTIIDPFLYTPNVEGDTETKLGMSRTIAASCLKLLEDCDVIMALTDDNDTGTALEAGYAHCMNIPVILISSGSNDTANAMLLGIAKERIDNVLEDAQMETLAHMLIWFHAGKTNFSSVPGNN
jgi:nucleoside 2-deoxyribosyltransferase